MDHFEGVVLDYLRADRALFVNCQCCSQPNEGKPRHQRPALVLRCGGRELQGAGGLLVLNHLRSKNAIAFGRLRAWDSTGKG